MNGESLYWQYAATIDAVIRAVCRRRRLDFEHSAELASEFRLKLIERDYAVLRQIKDSDKAAAFLATVCERLLLDRRVAQWGKWRPSETAKRLGPLALALECALSRDGMSYEDAVEFLVSRGIARARKDVDEIRPKLTLRSRRWMVSHELIGELTGPTTADADLVRNQRAAVAGNVAACLARALVRLRSEDQLMLRLRFQGGFTVARIAEFLARDQKALYRHIERLLRELRTSLESAGVSREDVRDLLGAAGDYGMDDDFRRGSPENETRRPSMGEPPEGENA